VRNEIDHGARWPSGGVIATVIDLARFAQMFLNDGKGVMSPEQFKLFTTPQVTWACQGSDTNKKYRYGLFREYYRGLYLITSPGSRPGYKSVFCVIPEKDFAFSVLVNSMQVDFQRITETVIDSYFFDKE